MSDPPRLSVVLDGVVRELITTSDLSGDGQLDTAAIDVGGEWYVFTDVDGDGLPDVLRVVASDGGRRLLARSPGSAQFNLLADSGALDDSIEEDASHWFTQATNYTCGPAAITMILADMFDVRIPDETEVWQRAIDMDAITEKGMRPREIESVIRSYGIPASTIQTDTRHLDWLLEQGHEAIVMVDADEYYPFEGRGPRDVRRKRPHAVRLLGIDHETSTAILSDSGWPNPIFSQLRVPLEHFTDAWADLDWLAVVTNVTHADVREHLNRNGVQIDDPPTRRMGRAVPTIFLPFAMRLSRALRALDPRSRPKGR